MVLEDVGSRGSTESVTALVGPLAEALAQVERLVALTGAGISTESGIPDYRSANGLWARHTPIYYADFVRNPGVRRRYWARSLNGYGRFRNAQPNLGHKALAAMEQAGRLHFLVTQNVDRLHTLAGSRHTEHVRCLRRKQLKHRAQAHLAATPGRAIKCPVRPQRQGRSGILSFIAVAAQTQQDTVTAAILGQPEDCAHLVGAT